MGLKKNGLGASAPSPIPQRVFLWVLSQNAFNGVGTALVVTTLILVAGFAILAQSSFGVNSYMAMLTAIALVIALIADLTLLPALLIVLDKDKAVENSSDTPPTVTASSQAKTAS